LRERKTSLFPREGGPVRVRHRRGVVVEKGGGRARTGPGGGEGRLSINHTGSCEGREVEREVALPRREGKEGRGHRNLVRKRRKEERSQCHRREKKKNGRRKGKERREEKDSSPPWGGEKKGRFQ